jgi:hypothetical protein
MDTTKVASLARSSDKAYGIARGLVGENTYDARIFGSSWRDDYIFTVR